MAMLSINGQRLIGRMILDQEFRHKLYSEPETTMQGAELALDEAEIAHLSFSIREAKRKIEEEIFLEELKKLLAKEEAAQAAGLAPSANPDAAQSGDATTSEPAESAADMQLGDTSSNEPPASPDESHPDDSNRS